MIVVTLGAKSPQAVAEYHACIGMLKEFILKGGCVAFSRPNITRECCAPLRCSLAFSRVLIGMLFRSSGRPTVMTRMRTGSSDRSGHKRLVFRVAADVFLHKRANRNDSQLVLARIFQCSMGWLAPCPGLGFPGPAALLCCVRNSR